MTAVQRNVTRGHGRLEGFLAKKRAGKANSLIPGALKNGRVLDVGCGFSPYFLTQTEFSEKYGLDRGIDEGLRKEFQKSHEIMLVDFDIEYSHQIPFSDGFFDVVTMLAVFEHFEPAIVPGIVSEIIRVLKPGGVFIMTTPARWTKGLLKLLARINMVSREEIEEHKGAYTRSQVLAILERCGFSRPFIRSGYFELFMNIWARAKKE
ncbi:MAG TPA: class I SAM-dependent methyltransferase [Syntrophorhabdaceae bacterium]|nr:class I SAM-dependent methyltransferase [Syntrophorhabdaceae bacterium]